MSTRLEQFELLTPRQKELLYWFYHFGGDLAQADEKMCIVTGTRNAHLNAICLAFNLSGHKRQMDLIRIVLQDLLNTPEFKALERSLCAAVCEGAK